MLLLTSSDQLALTYWMYGVQGNQISGKTELPDSCRCRRACARTTGKNSWRASGGDSVGRRRGLFWWPGSINIALLPPRLLVCLAAQVFTVQSAVGRVGQVSKWHARLNGCVRACNSANYLFSHTSVFHQGGGIRHKGVVCYEEHMVAALQRGQKQFLRSVWEVVKFDGFGHYHHHYLDAPDNLCNPC